MTLIERMITSLRFAADCMGDLQSRMVEGIEIIEAEKSYVTRVLGLVGIGTEVSRVIGALQEFHGTVIGVGATLEDAVAALEAAKNVDTVQQALSILYGNDVRLIDAKSEFNNTSRSMVLYSNPGKVLPSGSGREAVNSVFEGITAVVRQANGALDRALQDNDEGTWGLKGP